MIIIPSSWGFQLDSDLHQHRAASVIYINTVPHQPPILVGHQDYFLAPLSGSEALLKSGIGK
jgi:hypothetical protein